MDRAFSQPSRRDREADRRYVISARYLEIILVAIAERQPPAHIRQTYAVAPGIPGNWQPRPPGVMRSIFYWPFNETTLAGRDFVTPDDVKAMAAPVLEHRLILRPEFEIEGMTPGEAVQKILESVTVPV